MRYVLPFLLASIAQPSLAEVPKVIADLPPIHALVAQVMQGVGEPVLLLDRGADAHSFQLRPSQAAALADADLVVWVGVEMTPWLDRALQGMGTSGTQLDLIHADGVQIRHLTAEDQHGADDDHGHDHSGVDPHAWLNPDNARVWLDRIATELARLDPENSATYTANAQAAQQDLLALDKELAETLARLRDRPFVVFHDAYGYFTDHYGLNRALSIATGDAVAPGAAHLSDLRSQLSGATTTCLFPEAQHDPALVEQLAEAPGARIGGALDPEGSLLTPGPDAYAQLLRGLARQLAACMAP